MRQVEWGKGDGAGERGKKEEGQRTLMVGAGTVQG